MYVCPFFSQGACTSAPSPSLSSSLFRGKCSIIITRMFVDAADGAMPLTQHSALNAPVSPSPFSCPITRALHYHRMSFFRRTYADLSLRTHHRLPFSGASVPSFSQVCLSALWSVSRCSPHTPYSTRWFPFPFLARSRVCLVTQHVTRELHHHRIPTSLTHMLDRWYRCSRCLWYHLRNFNGRTQPSNPYIQRCTTCSSFCLQSASLCEHTQEGAFIRVPISKWIGITAS